MTLLNQNKVAQSTVPEVNANNASGITLATLSNSYAAFKANSSSWIIDSGASDHMYFNPSSFLSLLPLPVSIMVKLSDFSIVKVTHAGRITISEGLILEHVLHVPSFKYNLLSIHKLCISFSASFYSLLLDAFCRALIKRPQVLGEAKGGLYLLEPSGNLARNLSSVSAFSFSKNDESSAVSAKSFPISAKSESDVNLWHVRLGHLPFQAMKHIRSLSFPNLSHCPCAICPLARQSRNLFPISLIKSKQMFELIHVDTWGPFKTPTYNGYFPHYCG